MDRLFDYRRAHFGIRDVIHPKCQNLLDFFQEILRNFPLEGSEEALERNNIARY